MINNDDYKQVDLPLETSGAGLAGIHYVAIRDGALHPSPALIDDLGIISGQCYAVEINEKARRLRLIRTKGGDLTSARCGGALTPRHNGRMRLLARTLIEKLGLPADVSAICKASGTTDHRGGIVIEMEYPAAPEEGVPDGEDK